MSKEIYITSNTPLYMFLNARKHEVDSISKAINKAGYTYKVITAPDMFMSIDTAPYATINLTGWTSDRHVAYLKELENLKTKLLNPIYTSRIADDKMLSYFELAPSVSMAFTMYLDITWPPIWPHLITKINQCIGFPCVIKVTNGGRGVGVHKVDNSADLIDLFGLLKASIIKSDNGQTSSNLILQKYIPETYGKNVRVFVLGNRCLGAMLRTSTKGWKTGQPMDENFGINERREQFKLDCKLEAISLKVCRLLNLNYAAIDFLFGPDGYIVNEINTCPDTKAFEECNNLSVYDQVVDHLINVIR